MTRQEAGRCAVALAGLVTLASAARANDTVTMAEMQARVCASVAAWAPVARVSVVMEGHATLVFDCGDRLVTRQHKD